MLAIDDKSFSVSLGLYYFYFHFLYYPAMFPVYIVLPEYQMILIRMDQLKIRSENPEVESF